VLHRERSRRAEAGLRLFRERAWTPISGEPAHPRRGAPDRGERRQAAGAVARVAPAIISLTLRPTLGFSSEIGIKLRWRVSRLAEREILKILAKTLRVLGAIVAALIVVAIGLIMFFDPPPLRLRDDDKVVVSVPPARKLDGLQHRLEEGVACKLKLESYSSSMFGRPMITFFDWLKHSQAGHAPEPDVHVYGSKPDDTWAIKVDRSTNTVCYHRPSDVKAGIPDAYCGPKIIHENANRLVAIEDRDFEVVRAIYFDKKTYTLMMTELGEVFAGSASMEYFECY
jgi:hypothetical protein